MALQDTISRSSQILARAESTVSYIFDQLNGPRPEPQTGGKAFTSSLCSDAESVMNRLEQLDSQLEGLRDLLIAPPQEMHGGRILGLCT